jgi:hypothetical protein
MTNTHYQNFQLDSIANAATYFLSQWTPDLKRNQSSYLLTLIISKLYGASKGSLFHARSRASHASLAASLNLSREWTCKLIGKLREAGWITTEAPRLPNSPLQEVTIFKPGGKLKKLLVMLLKSKQRLQQSVNGQQQKIPTKEEVSKNLAFLSSLRDDLAKKLGMKT